jgi:CheY-like chemotaxis protein
LGVLSYSWGLIGGSVKNRFILLADTSDAFLGILKEELATTVYALLHAKDGQEAINYLDLLKSEIELVIIDLELPVVSGIDVIWRLVRQKQRTPTKIIATSAVNVPLLKQVVQELGVAAVVQTPIPAQSWRKVLEGVLSGELSGYCQVTNSSAAPGT